MAEYPLKRNDRLPVATATLKDVNGAVNLTNATSIKFIMKAADGSLKIDAAAEFVVKADGTVKYAWAAGDTDTAGDFPTEWEVTWGTGEKQTFPNTGHLTTRIVEDLG